MLATLRSVEAALTARHGCDAWNLHLDKLSFDRDVVGAEAKGIALRRILDSWRNKAAPYLKDTSERKQGWLDRLAVQHGARFRRVLLSSESRLLLHFGRASALENIGLYSDRTTGLPLIPGTAFKGALSTWACWEANLNDQTGFNEGAAFRQHRREFESPTASSILGDDSKNASNRSGNIIFVGGFPAESGNLPRLEIDILTPHPDNGRGRILPNVFLTWAPNSVWQFVFYARPGIDNAGAVLDQTEIWLCEALTTTGIGAKTAAGYGRFRLPNDEERKRIKKQDGDRLDAERKRLDDELAKAVRNRLPPDERAFAEYAAGQNDWVGAAREIAARPEQERQWILRHFRSASGQALLKTWNNDKGKKRIENLKAAGL